jgi:hypothetical protein
MNLVEKEKESAKEGFAARLRNYVQVLDTPVDDFGSLLFEFLSRNPHLLECLQ